MARRTKINNPLKCEHCNFFEKSQDRKIMRKGNQVIMHQRDCPIKDEFVEPDDGPCNGFVLSKYVWCKNGGRVHVDACIGRRLKEVDECIGCRIGYGIEIMKRFKNDD